MNLNELYGILKQQLDVYTSYLEVVNKKYDAIFQENIPVLNDILSEEEVFYMKFRGLEQKREKLLAKLGPDVTLKQIIEDMEDVNDKERFSSMYRELKDVISKVKEQHESCKTIVGVKMHTIETVLERIDKDGRSTAYDVEGIKEGGSLGSLSKKI